MRAVFRAITGKFPRVFRQNSKLETKQNRLPQQGMWVIWKSENKIGILVDMQKDDICTVMLVDPEEGTNVVHVNCLGADLRQAYYTEIPIKRRPAEDVCASLGYLRG